MNKVSQKAAIFLIIGLFIGCLAIPGLIEGIGKLAFLALLLVGAIAGLVSLNEVYLLKGDKNLQEGYNNFRKKTQEEKRKESEQTSIETEK